MHCIRFAFGHVSSQKSSLVSIRAAHLIVCFPYLLLIEQNEQNMVTLHSMRIVVSVKENVKHLSMGFHLSVPVYSSYIVHDPVTFSSPLCIP